MRWTKALLEEVAQFTNNYARYAPSEPVGEEEHNMGTVDVGLRPLFGLMKFYERQIEELMLERRYTREGSIEHMQLGGRAAIAVSKHKVLRHMFWAEIHEAHGLWSDSQTIGVRDNWQVVTFETKPDEVQDLLRRIMR